MALTEANVCLRWLEECGRIDPIYPVGDGLSEVTWGNFRNRGWIKQPRVSAMFVNDDGHLIFRRNSNGQLTEMARFVGERRLIRERGGVVLLNGDGFPDTIRTNAQTRLRDRARRKFPSSQVMIVPYAALTGAEIVVDSILPIHISADTWATQRIYLRQVPQGRTATPEERNRGVSHPSLQTTINGRQFRFIPSRHPLQMPMQVLHNGDWVPVQRVQGRSFFTLRTHNLGSSVFSAVGPDGDRHRYISAFDPQERRMYFLAQLPDEGECNNYLDAIDLLAPPIVHQARAEGKRVARQGDIFAIETDLTDRDMMDAKIVRRDMVFVANALKLKRTSKVTQRLRIYGTGHTATIVAVRPNGTTFVKGTMFHDPMLERVGRTREHANTPLPDGKWCLCCRNTVPRATPKTTTRRGAA